MLMQPGQVSLAVDTSLAPLAGCSRAGHQPHKAHGGPRDQSIGFGNQIDLLGNLASMAYWLCHLEQNVFPNRLTAENCCQE